MRDPERAKFAFDMTQVIRDAGEKAWIDFDSKRFRLAIDPGGPGACYLNLENAFIEHGAAPPEERRAVLERWASVRKVELPVRFDAARPRLLPLVRERLAYELTKLSLQIEGETDDAEPAHRPFAGHLVVALGYDHPTSIQHLTEHDLGHWRVSFDDALAIARENLERRSDEPFVELEPGVFGSPWDDAYDVSRLLLPKLVRRLTVRGDPVAVATSHNGLLVAGSEDPEALTTLAESAKIAVEEGGAHAMSPRPLRLAGSEWKPFLPPPRHPAHDAAARLHAFATVREYEDQRRLLEALRDKRGQSIFVPECHGVRRADGKSVTVTMWPSAPAVMPRTDDVMFVDVDADEVLLHVPWEHVERAFPDLMRPVGIYPERYRVDGLPPAERLEALRPFAVGE